MSITVTVDEVASWGKIKDVGAEGDPRYDELAAVLAGVIAVVDEKSLDWDDPPDTARQAAVNRGVAIMCHRVWTRKDSPHGALGFGAQGDLIRILQTDPDVRFFLGPWLIPGLA